LSAELSLQAPNSYEEKTLEIAQQLLTTTRERSWQDQIRLDSWSDRLLAWTMENPGLRVQLFRFIDCLPALRSKAEVARHLQEYLTEETVELPAALKALLNFANPKALLGQVAAQVIMGAVETLAFRYIAGETIEQTLKTLKKLRQQNMTFSVDLLGEAVITEVEAQAYLNSYLDLMEQLAKAAQDWPTIEQIDQADGESLPKVQVSVKLTAFYSQFDPLDAQGSREKVSGHIRTLLRRAKELGVAIHFDMEQYVYKTITFDILKILLLEPEFRDRTDIGVTLQAYLRESEQDAKDLIAWAKQRGYPITIRLVKGAYWDQETIKSRQKHWPNPVFTDKTETDANFERITQLLLQNHAVISCAIGSHNVRSHAKAVALAEMLQVPRRRWELQVLYGMGDRLAQALADRGYRVRVYCPYGKLVPGMAYLIRRLLENTANTSFLRQNFENRSGEELLANPFESSEFGVSPLETLRERSSELRSQVSDLGVRSFSSGDATRTEFEVSATEAFRKQGLEIGGQARELNNAAEADQTAPKQQLRTPNPVRVASPEEKLRTQKQLRTPNSVRVASPEEKLRTPNFLPAPDTDYAQPKQREAVLAAIARVRSQLGKTYWPLINGSFCQTEGLLNSENPCNPVEIVGKVGQITIDQAEQAIAAAKQAFPAWKKTPVARRAEILQKAADLMEKRRSELVAWVVLEVGKPIREADVEVSEAIDFCRYYAASMKALDQEKVFDVAGETDRYHYQPRGIALVISPWNFPIAIPTGMTVAALVTGNCTLLKPAATSSIIMAKVAEILVEAGIPKGVFQFVPGKGSTVGNHLVKHKEVHLIAFTGSREVGCQIYADAALLQPGQKHLKRVVAEMGGKNAIIVDESADLDQAVAGVVQSAYGYSGQKCSACSRAIVVKSVYAAFLERLIEATKSLNVGATDSPGVQMGPVIDGNAQVNIQAYIAQGKTEARLALEVPVPDKGYFVPPTIFADVSPQAKIAQEEIFGPVLAVMPAKHFGEALAIANSTDYALTGGLYSRTPSHIAQAKAEFEVGNLYINRGITGAIVARQPFGGFKLSGVGSKAGGPDYLLQFLEPRTVTENIQRQGFAPIDDEP
jgi:RHH-type proline utilization regulon transcriptional repressor/proline dehydrogenase/delta 1-pyrroline-5-carboxylate dehydrogenase